MWPNVWDRACVWDWNASSQKAEQERKKVADYVRILSYVSLAEKEKNEKAS